MNRKRLINLCSRFAPTVLSIAAVMLLSACSAWDSHQSALDPKGPVARDQYNTFMITLYVTTFLWVTVGGALLLAVWKFRLKKTDDPNVIPKQSHGHPMVEVGLIAFSTLCLVIIAVPTLRGIVFMKEVPAEFDTEDAIEITATGYQWWWSFQYDNEEVEIGDKRWALETANEFVVPVNTAVKIRLRSNDVIHSFWLPKLAGKVDLVPGQENFIWFLAEEEGYYYGQCAEYCGDSHAYMLFRTHVVSQEEYQEWLRSQKKGAVLPLRANPSQLVETHPEIDVDFIASGQKAFMTHCSACHQVDNDGGITGPDLAHLASRSTIAAGWLENTPENLFRWIRDPDSVKPGNYMWKGVPIPGPAGVQVMEGLNKKNISDDEIHAIVAYLNLLK